MRQIKFRGKRLYDGKWVYGCPLIVDTEKYQSANIVTLDEVYPDTLAKVTTSVDFKTLGQFTGLKDRNGREIYECDIVQWGDSEHKIKQVVEFRNGAFGYVYDTIGSFVPYAANTNFDFAKLGTDKRFEVIGNVFDNPSLIEKGGEK